jgi:SHS2 domain-containing protein
MSRNVPGFSLIEHPADLGIEAFGKTLPEAFEQAAVGLMSVIVDLSMVEPAIAHEVRLQAADREHLLVKWLTEVLYLYDGQKFVGREFKVRELRGNGLEAMIWGETLAQGRHETRMDVKAVTYHQLSVTETDGEALVRVFLDI